MRLLLHVFFCVGVHPASAQHAAWRTRPDTRPPPPLESFGCINGTMFTLLLIARFAVINGAAAEWFLLALLCALVCTRYGGKCGGRVGGRVNAGSRMGCCSR